MKALADLVGVCAGAPAAILGAGPSLPGDLATVPPSAILIGVNHHTRNLCGCDFLVFLDLGVFDRLDGLAGIKVCSLPHLSDIAPAGLWTNGRSATTAAWLADHMGCDRIVLCGMDCCQGDRNYWYQPAGAGFPGLAEGHRDIRKHLMYWHGCRERCRHPERIRAASGPLIDIFGRWDDRNHRGNPRSRGNRPVL